MIIAVIINSYIEATVLTNDFLPEDFLVYQQREKKLDENIDILDGKINNSYVKPLSARVPTDIYILDSGCYPLVQDFVGDKIGYHGMAVLSTMHITLPEQNTNIKCIKTLPSSGSGDIKNYVKALQYIFALPRLNRTIINISASVPTNNYTQINRIIIKMARKGYEFVIAAGNIGNVSPKGPDACLYSMTNLSRFKNVYVVGAPELWSRTGKCVEKIYPSCFKSVNALCGTSFSAPIFVGILSSL
jgi:hypothetical protein